MGFSSCNYFKKEEEGIRKESCPCSYRNSNLFCLFVWKPLDCFAERLVSKRCLLGKGAGRSNTDYDVSAKHYFLAKFLFYACFRQLLLDIYIKYVK